jgi:hypothetical protein
MLTEILDSDIKHLNVMGRLDEHASEIIDHVGMYVHLHWVAFDTYHLDNDTTAFIIRVCNIEDDYSTNTNLKINNSVWADIAEPVIVITREKDDDHAEVGAHAWQTYINKCKSFATGNF